MTPDRSAADRDAPASPPSTPPADWLTPGAKVVVLSGRNLTPSPDLTIERVMKRDVVLSNGDRWSLARLAPDRRHILKRSASAWDPSSALFPADAPEVETARRESAERMEQSRMRSLAGQLADEVRAENWPTAAVLLARLAALIEPRVPKDT